MIANTILLFNCLFIIIVNQDVNFVSSFTTTSVASKQQQHRKQYACRNFPSPLSKSSSTTTLHASNEPLAEEGDWAAYLDEDNTGLVYYFNSYTGESLWEKPTPSFPDVSLSREQRTVARRKLNEYKEKRKQEEKEEQEQGLDEEGQGTSGGGFFASVFGSTTKEEEEATVTSTSVSDEEAVDKEWFSGLFDSVQTKKDNIVAEETVTEEKKEDVFGNLFSDIKSKLATEKETIVKSESIKKEEEVKSKPTFDFSGMFEKKEPATTAEAATIQAEKSKPVKKAVTPAPTVVVYEEEEEEEEMEEELPMQINVGTCILPHPEKIMWGGEDALFVQGRTFGVFDGVSGAIKLDGVPLYSKTLANEMKRLCLVELADNRGIDMGLNVKKLTTALTKSAEVADDIATGASTAVVASITDDNFLRVLNLGDSVCLLVRNGKLKARTRDLSHYFDCPYQLSTDSPDRPRDGTKLNIELLKGDTILMGSDGVFDNLSNEQILSVLTEQDGNPKVIAKRICDLSRKVSKDDMAETPYAKLAKRNGEIGYSDGLGGKIDDISCIAVCCE